MLEAMDTPPLDAISPVPDPGLETPWTPRTPRTSNIELDRRLLLVPRGMAQAALAGSSIVVAAIFWNVLLVPAADLPGIASFLGTLVVIGAMMLAIYPDMLALYLPHARHLHPGFAKAVAVDTAREDADAVLVRKAVEQLHSARTQLKVAVGALDDHCLLQDQPDAWCVAACVSTIY